MLYNHLGLETEDLALDDAEHARAAGRRLTEYHDDHPEAGLFTPWEPVDHPQLGTVEVGGRDRVRYSNPPPSALQTVAERVIEFALSVAEWRPEVTVSPRAEPLGEDRYRVVADLHNRGALATGITDRGERTHPRSAPSVRLEGGGPVGRRGRRVGHLDAKAGEATAEWVVRAPDGPLSVTVDAPRGVSAKGTVDPDGREKGAPVDGRAGRASSATGERRRARDPVFRRPSTGNRGPATVHRRGREPTMTDSASGPGQEPDPGVGTPGRDGETDDAPAFESAVETLAGAGEGVLVVDRPPAVYRLATQVAPETDGAGVRVRGVGVPTLDVADVGVGVGGNRLELRDAPNVSMERVTIRGPNRDGMQFGLGPGDGFRFDQRRQRRHRRPRQVPRRVGPTRDRQGMGQRAPRRRRHRRPHRGDRHPRLRSRGRV